ncbi:hypothetical protein EVAR_68341_1 [Eumeta japonica]|uniref:Uncharacterized protein n=1 Tax=Eumeta variegata TaxID=151549 RepID=A0A4C1SJF5_EUMVA|nr:hypothetical protein EVAR_68341_1 [Eumeta japonica]
MHTQRMQLMSFLALGPPSLPCPAPQGARVPGPGYVMRSKAQLAGLDTRSLSTVERVSRSVARNRPSPPPQLAVALAPRAWGSAHPRERGVMRVSGAGVHYATTRRAHRRHSCLNAPRPALYGEMSLGRSR